MNGDDDCWSSESDPSESEADASDVKSERDDDVGGVDGGPEILLVYWRGPEDPVSTSHAGMLANSPIPG